MQTILLVLVTTAVSIYALINPPVLERLILWPVAINRKRQYERFLTHGFIHADNQHLLFNMITLYFFGRAVEGIYDRLIGPFGFVLFYLGALVFSILPTYADHRRDARYRSLGASGGVSAVLFAFILFAPWSTIYVFVLPVPAIVYAILYIGWEIYSARRRSDNVNHSAHLWGAAYGVALTLLLAPSVLSLFLQRLAHP
ncbi:MAG: rhomboid family intramembrane serine protease [Nevskia sp.]